MTTTRSSYQEGSIDRVSRAKDRPDVWVYRWRETAPDGKRVQRKKVIGDVTKYKTRSDAKKAVENLRAQINADTPLVTTMTVEEAWGHFQMNELHDPEINRSTSTISNYKTLFATHILPHWGSVPLNEVDAVDVEAWLRRLKTAPVRRKGEEPSRPVLFQPDSRPLAPATKSKIKSRMYTLFEHAKRHKLHTANPMESVRQGSKRAKKPHVLTISETVAIMSQVTNPAIRLAVLVAGVTGLRRSEIRGLKWQDVDPVAHWLHPTQGYVGTEVTPLKTEASGEVIPIPAALSVAFTEWRSQTLYCADEDWVFASPATSGRSPYWFDSALVRQLRPAAKRAQVTKRLGWHTFRRSLATLLTSRKEGVKVVQSLMRHADPRITMELYAQGEEESMREAQKHLSGLFLADKMAS
jgi:integrase